MNLTLILFVVINAICIIVLIIGLRFTLKRSLSSTLTEHKKQWTNACAVCFIILFIIALPISLTWLILSHTTRFLNRKEWGFRHDDTLGFKFKLFLCVIIPLSFIGFIITITLHPNTDSFGIQWVFLLCNTIFVLGATLAIIVNQDIEEGLCACCSMTCLFPIYIAVGNIVCLMSFISLIGEPFVDIVQSIVGFPGFDQLKANLYQAEYLRYIKYKEMFVNIRKELLLEKLNGTLDVVNVIFEYLDAMEIRDRGVLNSNRLFMSRNGYMNDCGVISTVYDVKLETVRYYARKKRINVGKIDDKRDTFVVNLQS